MSSVEYKFVLNPKNTEEYAGKWIAVLGTKVIASGKDIEKVYKEAQEIPSGELPPLFEYIPLKEEEETLIL